jgi:hypothetical protein
MADRSPRRSVQSVAALEPAALVEVFECFVMIMIRDGVRSSESETRPRGDPFTCTCTFLSFLHIDMHCLLITSLPFEISRSITRLTASPRPRPDRTSTSPLRVSLCAPPSSSMIETSNDAKQDPATEHEPIWGRGGRDAHMLACGAKSVSS